MTDRNEFANPLRGVLGAQFKDTVRGYIGDPTGEIFAVDDTDLFNTIYVRRDKDSNERLICYYDPLKFNSEQFRFNMAIKMSAYFDDKPGVVKRVRYCLEGADELVIGQQAGAFDLDPAGGFGAVVLHGHTSDADGGQLDIGAAVGSGILGGANGGTGNNLNSTDDGALMAWNGGAFRIEPANLEFGALVVGRDTGAPNELVASAAGSLARAYFDGIGTDWEDCANRFGTPSDPLPTNDITEFFRIGSWWFNALTPQWWLCVDNAEDAAVWQRVEVGAPLNNYTATVAPTTSDDIDAGYSVGSRWFDTVAFAIYTCWDAASGAAVWVQDGGALLNNMSASGVPTSGDDESLGYSVGSWWYDTDTLTLYGCINASTGSAEWEILSSRIPPPANINTVSVNSNVTPTNYTMLVDTSAGAITITLPAASDNYGRRVVIKNIGTDTVTIDGDGANIDGNATHDLTSQWEVVQLHCNGSDWFII